MDWMNLGRYVTHTDWFKGKRSNTCYSQGWKKNLGFLEEVFRFLKVFLGFLDFSVQRQLDKPFSLSLCFLQIITKPTNFD